MTTTQITSTTVKQKLGQGLKFNLVKRVNPGAGKDSSNINKLADLIGKCKKKVIAFDIGTGSISAQIYDCQKQGEESFKSTTGIYTRGWETIDNGSFKSLFFPINVKSPTEFDLAMGSSAIIAANADKNGNQLIKMLKYILGISPNVQEFWKRVKESYFMIKFNENGESCYVHVRENGEEVLIELRQIQITALKKMYAKIAEAKGEDYNIDKFDAVLFTIPNCYLACQEKVFRECVVESGVPPEKFLILTESESSAFFCMNNQVKRHYLDKKKERDSSEFALKDYHEKVILNGDMGKGTLNISLLFINKKGKCNVISREGTNLGGERWTREVMRMIAVEHGDDIGVPKADFLNKYKGNSDLYLSAVRMALEKKGLRNDYSKLEEDAETLKLNFCSYTNVEKHSFLADYGGNVKKIEIKRCDFLKETAKLTREVVKLFRKAVNMVEKGGKIPKKIAEKKKANIFMLSGAGFKNKTVEEAVLGGDGEGLFYNEFHQVEYSPKTVSEGAIRFYNAVTAGNALNKEKNKMDIVDNLIPYQEDPKEANQPINFVDLTEEEDEEVKEKEKEKAKENTNDGEEKDQEMKDQTKDTAPEKQVDAVPNATENGEQLPKDKTEETGGKKNEEVPREEEKEKGEEKMEVDAEKEENKKKEDNDTSTYFEHIFLTLFTDIFEASVLKIGFEKENENDLSETSGSAIHDELNTQPTTTREENKNEKEKEEEETPALKTPVVTEKKSVKKLIHKPSIGKEEEKKEKENEKKNENRNKKEKEKEKKKKKDERISPPVSKPLNFTGYTNVLRRKVEMVIDNSNEMGGLKTRLGFETVFDRNASFPQVFTRDYFVKVGDTIETVLVEVDYDSSIDEDKYVVQRYLLARMKSDILAPDETRDSEIFDSVPKEGISIGLVIYYDNEVTLRWKLNRRIGKIQKTFEGNFEFYSSKDMIIPMEKNGGYSILNTKKFGENGAPSEEEARKWQEEFRKKMEKEGSVERLQVCAVKGCCWAVGKKGGPEFSSEKKRKEATKYFTLRHGNSKKLCDGHYGYLTRAKRIDRDKDAAKEEEKYNKCPAKRSLNRDRQNSSSSSSSGKKRKNEDKSASKNKSKKKKKTDED